MNIYCDISMQRWISRASTSWLRIYTARTTSSQRDPVVLFKLVMIQQLSGIESLRQTLWDAEVNAAYRWFLG